MCFSFTPEVKIDHIFYYMYYLLIKSSLRYLTI